MGDYSQQILPINELTIEQINSRFRDINYLIENVLSLIKIDSYVGDGIKSRRYTGIGFTPKLVIIFVYIVSSNVSEYHIISIITDSNKLISDGFVINNDGRNVNNNEKSVTYEYVAFK